MRLLDVIGAYIHSVSIAYIYSAISYSAANVLRSHTLASVPTIHLLPANRPCYDDVGIDDEEDVSAEFDYEPGDVLGKCLALVNQVSKDDRFAAHGLIIVLDSRITSS